MHEAGWLVKMVEAEPIYKRARGRPVSSQAARVRFSRCENGQPTSAAADIQQMFTTREFQFPANHVQFVFLGLCKRIGIFPISAAVDHAWVKHGAKHVIAGCPN